MLKKLLWILFKKCDETCQSFSLLSATHYHKNHCFGWSNKKKRFLTADDEEVSNQAMELNKK